MEIHSFYFGKTLDIKSMLNYDLHIIWYFPDTETFSFIVR